MRANRIRLRNYSTFDQPPQRHRVNGCSHPTSKSVVFILIWGVVVGFINSEFTSSLYTAVLRIYSGPELNTLFVSIMSVFFYIVLAAALVSYPLGGFVADVYFGRYKTVMGSLILLTVSLVVALAEVIFILQSKINASSSSFLKAVYVLGGLTSGFTLIMGLAGFTSNVFQFGLDQLQDAPSRKLGIFIHSLVWALRIGDVLYHLPYAMKNYLPPPYSHTNESEITPIYLYSTLTSLISALIAMLVLNCFTHRMFNKERVKYNPYKMIFRILNFARKHKRPVGHPSAFAYCDTFKPSRMDYAKERYGGPFTTSDVEDVKTFTRVSLLILTLGPVFVIDVPTSHYLFFLFGTHTGTNTTAYTEGLLLQRGVLSNFSSIVIFPVYTWLLFFLLYKLNRLPPILYRIMFAIALSLFTMVGMFAVDLTGHAILTASNIETVCMLYHKNYTQIDTESLNLHWSVLILPNLTKTLALDLIMASTFEFISAQSPHTMKGVLVGLLFAVRGFFQLIEAVLLFPFSMEQIWEKLQVTPYVNCGTSYFIITIAIALLGTTIFAIAARKYQYRKREEEPYSQSRVEEIYDRMLREREQRQAVRINAIHEDENNVGGGEVCN